ncbi:hypothetical protein [Actinophytocola glycyrrhizae]|uniref:HTH cro/C1-type domain-containing protein n=1 Tax=Actinophytocola glycyrrhizae TaxID=2044873 RepID=A0ABV9RYY7_9PSEU
MSAYENGRKKPTLDTAEHLLTASGFELYIRPRISFRAVPGTRGHVHEVPDQLPSLPPHKALATVELPLSLNWSQPGREYRLRDRSDRARVYEAVLREGSAKDVLTYVDGALLVDLWDELVLPPGRPRRMGPAGLGVGRLVSTSSEDVPLTDFQLQVAKLFFGLPASDGFVLAGGAALIAQHLTCRPTQDLDFFTDREPLSSTDGHRRLGQRRSTETALSLRFRA